MVLAGCSSASEGSNSASGLTVETNTLGCTTKDGVETDVVCEVEVSNVQVSEHAITVAINAYVWDLLPRVCGNYEQNPLLSDPQGFNENVEVELSATVAKTGTGWSVDSVSCKAAK